MDWVFNGLPVHALLVHFTVVIIPTAALALVLSAFWPAARPRLGILTPALALAALIAVPLTVNAGKWLYERVAHTPAAQAHEAIGASILPWTIGLFVVAALQWAWYRFGEKWSSGQGDVAKRRNRFVVGALLTAAVLVTSVGSVATVVIVGEAGTSAVWEGNFDE